MNTESSAGQLRLELALVVLAGWTAFMAIPVATGGIGISWDALNHQVYLGWIAAAPRFHLDVLAASYQTYQFPYLYWPLYQMTAAGASGVQAGVVLATLHAISVPPVWLIARAVIPGVALFDVAMRCTAVLLAFVSGVVLSQFDSTSNDLLAAIPLLWAVAVVFPTAADQVPGRSRMRRVLLSGALSGVSVAFKLSNAPLVLAVALLWWLAARNARLGSLALAAGGAAAAAAFALVYGFWGWQLWSHFGNPFFPFAHEWIAPPIGAAPGARP